jgi:hypothetical protein
MLVNDVHFPGLEHHSKSNQPQRQPTLNEKTFRWLFYIFGGVLLACKLFSLGGVPWSQAWGAMFVASFVITELILLGPKPEILSSGSTRPISFSSTFRVQHAYPKYLQQAGLAGVYFQMLSFGVVMGRVATAHIYLLLQPDTGQQAPILCILFSNLTFFALLMYFFFLEELPHLNIGLFF